MTERRIIDRVEELYESSKAIQPFARYHVPELELDVVEHPQLLSPRFSYSGIWTVKNWDLEAGMSVLDMGTGTGIIGVSAIVKANALNVLSADISPLAVQCATETAAINNASHRMQVVQSDLFGGLPPGKKDRIIFNPPFWDKNPDPENPITSACCDPDRSVLRGFLASAPEFLSHTDSRALMVFSTQDNFAEVEGIIKAAKGLTVKNTVVETIGHTRVLFSLGRD